MTDDEHHDEADATPEELAAWDRKREEWRNVISEYVTAGYVWEEDRLTLTHASDAEQSITFDPYTLEASYSPKVVAMIKAEIERQKRSGEL